MKAIVVINGYGAVGKNEFCRLCSKITKVNDVSTVDKVKEAYILLGWDEDKTEIHRKALSDIKDISTKTLDHPHNYIKQKIEYFKTKTDAEILFIHSREPDEIRRFVDEFKCHTLLVVNRNVSQIISNHADANVGNFNYEFVVDNSGTLADLERNAESFIMTLRGYYGE
jgi:chlorite dismutase